MRRSKNALLCRIENAFYSNIVCQIIVFLVICSILGGCGGTSSNEKRGVEIPSYQLYLDIDFEGNLLFDTYDVDVLLDNEQLDTITHGTYYTKLLPSIDEGSHSLLFNKHGDESVKGEYDIHVKGDMTFKCRIQAKGSEVSIDEVQTEESVEGAFIRMINTEGMNLEDAKESLKDLGFVNVTSTATDDVIIIESNWVVTSQNIEPGKEYDKNIEIILMCEHVTDNEEAIGELESNQDEKDISEVAETNQAEKSNSQDRELGKDGVQDVSYHTMEYAGCSFSIPDYVEVQEKEDSRLIVFDEEHIVYLSYMVANIDDWDETMDRLLTSAKAMEDYEIIADRAVVIGNNQVFVIDANEDKGHLRMYYINADNKGVFMVYCSSPSSFNPYQEQIYALISSFDASGIDDFFSSLPSESNEDSNKFPKDNLIYDEDGYIIANYSVLESIKEIEKPNIHLKGTIVDTNNIYIKIEDENGDTWTCESVGGLDFTSYIGSKCDVYGFCSGVISSNYNTPCIDMAYEDSHVTFSDGKSYYPKDNDSYAQFEQWQFEEDKKENSGVFVWIPTNGGTKYHSYKGCSNMDNPIQVTESEAIERGFSRCGKCW